MASTASGQTSATNARAAQAAAAPQTPRATFSTRIEAVRVEAYVTRGDEPISGLAASDFELRDEGRPQEVSLIEERDAPVDVILALDVSASMKGSALDHLVQGVLALLDKLRPGDRLAVVTFSQTIRLPIPLTADHARIRELLSGLAAEGATAVNDAAYVALLSGDPGIRTLVIVFTDGIDISSWLTPKQTVDAARRMNAVVYGVMFTDAPIDRTGLKDAVIELVPKETGGRTLLAPGAKRLASVFGDILTEFRQRYILAFEPAEPVTPGWHALTLRVKRNGAQVSARAGYFASRR